MVGSGVPPVLKGGEGMTRTGETVPMHEVAVVVTMTEMKERKEGGREDVREGVLLGGMRDGTSKSGLMG